MAASQPEAVEHQEPVAEAPQQASCPRCGSVARRGRINRRIHGSAPRAAITTASRLERRSCRLVDADSFREQDSRLASTDPLRFVDETAYRERLLALKAETGESDALVSGFARLQGHEVAIAALDFASWAEAWGSSSAKSWSASQNARASATLPLISISASGGARMQEGMLSLLQMAKTSAAVQRLREAGCPYISILAHPTTGGVFASFANLGDIISPNPAP